MTRVDFYILDDNGDAPDRFVCRLTEKAYQQGHRVYVHTADPQQSNRLDNLLWQYRDGSFVPHSLGADDGADDPLTPVHIGHGEPSAEHHDVLVNLAGEVPLFFSRFERVAEVIGGGDDARAEGRERFRFYRERGYSIETHTIGSEQ